MKKIINTKTNDFKELIESNSLYVDKTLFLKEIIDEWGKPCLFPRPRRFGKSLNMSMIYYYFRNDFDSKYLFEGLNITKLGNDYLKEMNKYPTIFLSLKDTKFDTYPEFIINYKEIMKNLYDKYNYLLESDKLDETDKEDFRRIIRKEEDVLLANALSKLVGYLNKYYNEEVIVLLDEYDAPIIHGYEKGYYNEIIKFMAQLFVTTFKPSPVDSPVKKVVITGTTSICFADTFSGANNINVYSITDERYSDYFGFTEDEVIKLLEEYNLIDTKEKVKEWYDGYLFGDTTIYNPVSILNYLENKKFDPYWTNTGGIDLLKNLIYNLNNREEILNSYEDLLKIGYIEHINLNVNLDFISLEGNRDNIFTLFMLSGYLTPIKNVNKRDATLKIPNLEIRENLENIVKDWFAAGPLNGYDFTKYLYENDIEEFKRNFENIVIESFSYYDVPDNNNGENFYHAFTMGILSSGCSNYEITSNREAGYGRYDLILKPFDKNKIAYIIEFKVAGSDFDKAIEDGFRQIEEMKYEVSLKGYKIIKMVIAFKGKKLKIETR